LSTESHKNTDAKDLWAVQATLNGDPEAFEAIVKRYTPLLYSLALYARSVGELSPLQDGQLYDSHTLSLDALIRGEAGRILLEAGFLGSSNGTIEGQAPNRRAQTTRCSRD
jgi:hypothetical protein